MAISQDKHARPTVKSLENLIHELNNCTKIQLIIREESHDEGLSEELQYIMDKIEELAPLINDSFQTTYSGTGKVAA